MLKPFVDLCLKYDVAIEQLPCVEVFYEGLYRRACGQDRYLNERFLDICGKYVDETVYLMKDKAYIQQ